MTMHFLFHDGFWEGSGQITVPLAVEPLPLVVNWTVTPLDGERFRAVQEVTVEGQDPMRNSFTVKRISEGEFQVFLENEVIGTFSGTGVADEKKVAWEFAHKGALEGMEIYELVKQGEYSFHAEYLGGDGFSTTISGTIAEKST